MAEKKPEVQTFTPRTREELETALAERKRDASMLVPPAPWGSSAKPDVVVVKDQAGVQAVDRTALTKKKAELDKKLAEAARAAVEADAKLQAQKLIEKEEVEKRKKELETLTILKEAAELEAGRVQRELQEMEALSLLAEQEADARQRDHLAQVPAGQFEEAVQHALEPMIWKTATGYAKLKELLQKHESTLTRIDNLRAPVFTNENDRVSYINTSAAGGKLLRELKAVILEHHQVLQRAAGFKPVNSAEGHRKIVELQTQLENTSGIVLADRGAWVRLAGDTVNQSVKQSSEISSKEYNESPTTAHVDRFADMISNFLAQFAKVAKATPRPADIVITLAPRDKRPRHEQMAEMRGPKPEASHADGVPEGVK